MFREREKERQKESVCVIFLLLPLFHSRFFFFLFDFFKAAVNAIKAQLAYSWTTATNLYPLTPSQDAVAVSKTMQQKYAKYFATC